jgi:alkylated DNA repair protein alkB family protein 6
VITTVNLGSHTVLDFYEPAAGDGGRHVGSLLLEPRSLVVLSHSAYTDLHHGIRETNEDALDDSLWNLDATAYKDFSGRVVPRCAVRVSLTIRHVSKVLKVKLVNGRFVDN